MWKQAHNAYLESRILTADPMELVRLMYQAAIGEVREARQRLQERDIRGRASAITKACTLLTELNRALDRSLDGKSGGEYAERLAELYAYMMRRLAEANFEQKEEPLAEVLGLLSTLLEGWEGAQKQLEAAETPATPAPAAWAQSEDACRVSRAWNF